MIRRRKPRTACPFCDIASRLYSLEAISTEGPTRAPDPTRGPSHVLYRNTDMRALRARWIAWMTAVAVLLSMSVTARAPYFCHMMNRVVATSCCDAGEKHDDESACAVRVRATDCCERLSTATRSPTLKASASDLSVPAGDLAVAVLAPSYVFARATRDRHASRAGAWPADHRAARCSS